MYGNFTFLFRQSRSHKTDHFAVVCLGSWPLNVSGEAGVDLVLIETSLLNPHVNDAVLVLISMNLC